MQIFPKRKPKEDPIQAIRQSARDMKMLLEAARSDLSTSKNEEHGRGIDAGTQRIDGRAGRDPSRSSNEEYGRWIDAWTQRVVEGVEQGVLSPKSVLAIAHKVDRAAEHLFRSEPGDRRMVAIRAFNALARDRTIEKITVGHSRSANPFDPLQPHRGSPFASIYESSARPIVDQFDLNAVEHDGKILAALGLDDARAEWYRIRHRGRNPEEFQDLMERRLEQQQQRREQRVENKANKANERQAKAMSKQYQARLQQEQRVARRAADTVARQQRSAQARLDADAKAFHKATESFRKHWEQHLYQHDQGLWIALKNGTLPRQELQATLQRIAPRPSVLLQQHWYQQQQQQQQQQSSRQRQPAPQERVLPQAVDPWAAHPVDPTSKGQRKYAAAKPLAVPHPPRTNAPVAQPSSAPVASKDVADVRNRVTATADSMIKGAMSAQMDVMEQFREAAAAKGGPGVSLEDLGRMALQAAARGQFATPEDVKARGDAGKWGNIVGLRAIEAVVDGHIRAGGKLTDDQQTLLASIGRHQSEAMVSLATSLGQPLSKSAAYQGGSLQ